MGLWLVWLVDIAHIIVDVYKHVYVDVDVYNS